MQHDWPFENLLRQQTLLLSRLQQVIQAESIALQPYDNPWYWRGNKIRCRRCNHIRLQGKNTIFIHIDGQHQGLSGYFTQQQRVHVLLNSPLRDSAQYLPNFANFFRKLRKNSNRWNQLNLVLTRLCKIKTQSEKQPITKVQLLMSNNLSSKIWFLLWWQVHSQKTKKLPMSPPAFTNDYEKTTSGYTKLCLRVLSTKGVLLLTMTSFSRGRLMLSWSTDHTWLN